MGLFGGSTKTTTNEQFDTGPSKFQLPYLNDLFGSAQNLFNQNAASPYYQGETYAGMVPDQQKMLEALRSYASGQGLSTAGAISGIGSTLGGNAGNASNAMQAYYGAASADPTAANIQAASQYAQNPHIQQQIDSVAGDITRNLSEVTLPEIDRAATATGNLNSSRAGIASGIAQRGATEAIADAASSIRSGAWQQGLNLAESARTANMGALGDAARGFGSLTGQGIDAMTRGVSTGYGAYDAINGTHDREQADRQGRLDADFSKWAGQDERPWDMLSRYAGLVAGNQWGQSGTSNSTSKTKSGGSVLGSVLGAASSLGSLYTGLGGSDLFSKTASSVTKGG